MLRLVNPDKTRSVIILETEFQMRSLSVRDKFSIIEDLNILEVKIESFDSMVNILCRAIHSIAGDENVVALLNRIEALDDVLAIVNGVISYCSLTDDESKNSAFSSDTCTPVPAGK